MAEHIEDVASSSLPKITKAALYASLKNGDWIFCWGSDQLSKAIENAEKGADGTTGPSHVLLAWALPQVSQWLTLEATFGGKGVHVGLLKDYADSYQGDMVLSRRALTDTEVWATINKELGYIDEAYDWQSEVSFEAHRLCSLFPVDNPDNRLYCSALQQAGTYATSSPILTVGAIPATPEQLFTHPSVKALGAIVK